MDNHTKAQRSYNMSRIRSVNTQLELKFFQLLSENKIRYDNHPKIYGKPDCLIGEKLLVFVDSDFWHGWHFNLWKDRLPKEYWVDKIKRNIIRDQSKFRKLKRTGYIVVRIWGHELQKPNKVIEKIKKHLLNADK